MFYKAIQKIKVAWFFRHNAYVYVNFSAELIVDRTTSGLALLHKLMGCLHDPANVQQTSSKCNAGLLLEVC